MSSGGRKSKYYSFFSKRKASKSPSTDPEGRRNAPKKQHLDAAANRSVVNEHEVKEEEDANISGENLSEDVVAQIASNQSGPSSYAGVAEKKDYKFLTYLQKG